MYGQTDDAATASTESLIPSILAHWHYNAAVVVLSLWSNGGP